MYFITSKNKNILWHIFLIFAAEQTHAVIDNGLHYGQFNKNVCVVLCKTNIINIFVFYNIPYNFIL